MQKIHILVLSLALAASCCLNTVFASSAGGFELTSPAFGNGGAIPILYTRPAVGGNNVSVPLKWSGAPEGTRSFALSIVDIHPVANNWTHWLVINIPANVASLPEGASGKSLPSGAVELKNSFGSSGYGGPQPPKGTGPHSYVITIYALNADKLDLKPEANLTDFKKAISGKVIGEASTKGVFGQ